MASYKDYGSIQGQIAPNVLVETTRYSQVYAVTHDGAGNRLPHMKRSFISFTWGEKIIEDFNLLAIIENNALQRKLYADFEDNVTNSNIWDGQIYWSTHFNTNTIDFALFTDGITENQLSDFKYYFKPGIIRELVLSENPNRAILARVASVPEYSILPFEEEITTKIAGTEYVTSTTLYKGRINISFIMDEPFWYSKTTILDKLQVNGNYSSGQWIDANGRNNAILTDKDALKIIAEDGVPTAVMLQNLATTNTTTNSPMLFGITGTHSIQLNSSTSLLLGANINLSASTIYNDNNTTDTVSGAGFFYYAGTAPCAPILQFSLTPTVANSGYITSPRNSYGNTAGNQFNTIIIQSVNKKRFTFTTPGIYTGYNQAIKVFKNAGLIDAAWEEVRAAIRDNVKHWAPRAYAIAVINEVMDSTTQATAALLNTCVTRMRTFLLNNSNNIPSATYIFNCKTGKATATITYRTASNTVTSSEENVGDMVKSNYLIIEDRNYPNQNGFIEKWTSTNPQYSHRIYADIALSQLNLYYKYQYL